MEPRVSRVEENLGHLMHPGEKTKIVTGLECLSHEKQEKGSSVFSCLWGEEWSCFVSPRRQNRNTEQLLQKDRF